MVRSHAPVDREDQHESGGDAGSIDSDELNAARTPSVTDAVQRARSTPAPQVESPGRVQRSLRVGSADDPEEREADAVAERVVARLGHGPDAPAGGAIGAAGRQSATGESRVRRSAAPSARSRAGFETDETFTREVAGSSGAPMEEPVRREMESAFGHDFSAVRIHTGSRPDRLSRQIDAAAFTQANNVFFATGNYDPGTAEGAGLLAHELTHVVQQSGGATARRSVIRRRLTTESTAAFRTAVRSNPGYTAKRDLVDKVPGTEDDNVTDDEQKTLNDLSIGALAKLRTKKHRTGADDEAEQLEALGDLIKARNLGEFAERTAALSQEPVGDGQKYRTEKAKTKKRKFYLKKAKQQRNKDKNLIRLGVTAPETRVFLKEHGFTQRARDVVETTNPIGPTSDRQVAKTRPDDENALGVSIRQDVDEWLRGPRIEVRSTFIGGPILGINMRAHLFIVYTGRDGRQMYFRGGPSELGHTFADMGTYDANTIDYDPSAPSVTVMKGPDAEARLDKMISATKRINGMRVPYEAQILPEKFRDSDSTAAEYIGMALATDGENCNRTAWTILNAAGVPTKKPSGRHPGWGKPLGANIKGDMEMRSEGIDQLDRPITHTLTKDEAGSKGLFVQSYVDRALFQKKAKLPVGDEVQIVGEGAEYRAVLWNGEKHFIGKSDDETQRFDIFTVRDYLTMRGWSANFVSDLIDDARDDTAAGHADALSQLYDMEHELGVDLRTIASAIDLHLDDDNDIYMNEELDKLTDAQLKEMFTNIPRLVNFAKLVHQPSGRVMTEVRARVGTITAREELDARISSVATTPAECSMLVNDHPDYDEIEAIADELSRDFDDVFDAVNARRPTAVQGAFLDDLLRTMTPEEIRGCADGHYDLAPTGAQLGVDESWLLAKFKSLAPAPPPPPAKWADQEVALYPDGSAVSTESIKLSDAVALLDDAMGSGDFISVSYKNGFWNIRSHDFELIKEFRDGKLVDGARRGESAPSGGDAAPSDPEPEVSSGSRTIQILDDYSDEVVRTMSYDLAKGDLAASPWPRPSDTHMDVTYDMGTNGRVLLADWVEFQRFVTGEEAPAPAPEPSEEVVTDSVENADVAQTGVVGGSVTTDVDERLRLYPIILEVFRELEGFNLMTLGTMFDMGGGYRHNGETVSMSDISFVLEVDGATRGAAMAAALDCDVDEFFDWVG